MKKMIRFCVLALLCLNFHAVAQPTWGGLQVGDTIPEVLLTKVSNYPSPTAKLSSFKGKAMIIDFWATYCAPCIAILPRLDSMHRVYREQLNILSVTSQDEKTALGFLAKLEKKRGAKYRLVEVSGDRKLHALFPHTYIPHVVWIDPTGIVRAITDFKPLNRQTVERFLASGNLKEIAVKQDTRLIPYDASRSLFMDGNASPSPKLYFHSLLAGYKPGLTSGFAIRNDSLKNRVFTFRNTTIGRLFMVAYSSNGQVVNKRNFFIETKDSARISSRLISASYGAWLKAGNGYCYELLVSPSSGKQAYTFMQQDLSRYFPQYHAQLETRELPCLVLSRIGTKTIPASQGGLLYVDFDPFGYRLRNALLSELCNRLNFAERTPLHLVDETGLTERLDLDLHATVYELDKLNSELQPLGLKITRTTRPTRSLVLKDRSDTPN